MTAHMEAQLLSNIVVRCPTAVAALADKDFPNMKYTSWQQNVILYRKKN